MKKIYVWSNDSSNASRGTWFWVITRDHNDVSGKSDETFQVGPFDGPADALKNARDNGWEIPAVIASREKKDREEW